METISEVIRGNLVESRHSGYIVVVDAYGKTLYSSAPPETDRASFMRSAAKPMQAIPLVESGAADRFGLTPPELALACASHNGEPNHTRTAAHILKLGSFYQSQLLCGAHYPYHEPSAHELYRRDEKPSNLHSNCSGKHSGMLLTCKHMGWTPENYVAPEHPLQQAILGVVSDFTDVPADRIATGTDGCSVVCFGITTAQMALAFARFANPDYWQEREMPQRAAAVVRIREAMMDNPFYVGGTERGDTDLMMSAPGRIFSKIGAEAVWCMGFPEAGVGLAMKIDDGANRTEPVILAEVLRQTGLLGEAEIRAFEEKQVKPLQNVRGLVVGEYRATLRMEKHA
jgi:L-asparaginase II